MPIVTIKPASGLHDLGLLLQEIRYEGTPVGTHVSKMTAERCQQIAKALSPLHLQTLVNGDRAVRSTKTGSFAFEWQPSLYTSVTLDVGQGSFSIIVKKGGEIDHVQLVSFSNLSWTGHLQAMEARYLDANLEKKHRNFLPFSIPRFKELVKKEKTHEVSLKNPDLKVLSTELLPSPVNYLYIVSAKVLDLRKKHTVEMIFTNEGRYLANKTHELDLFLVSRCQK